MVGGKMEHENCYRFLKNATGFLKLWMLKKSLYIEKKKSKIFGGVYCMVNIFTEYKKKTCRENIL